MTHFDLVRKFKETGKFNKAEADKFLRTLYEVLGEGLIKDGVIMLTGFGKITAKRAMFRNPKTGGKVEGIRFGFKVSPTLKEKFNADK